jgi:uncharacterized protein (DUF2252 family)
LCLQVLGTAAAASRTVERHQRLIQRERDATAELPSFKPRPPLADLYARGRLLRSRCPRQGHAAWRCPAGRADPLRLLRESSVGRIPELVPVRHGRMMRSPFLFYRGAALNMAADLASTPRTGVRVQACGDCHLSNFGVFATPERRIVVDINDFDETLPAPWEWDVKRLATSFVLASRENGHGNQRARDAALTCVRAYRARMAELSEMSVLDVWYAASDLERLLPTVREAVTRGRARKRLAKARSRSVLEHDFPELVTTAGQAMTLRENPPLVFHPHQRSHAVFLTAVRRAFASYRDSLADHHRLLLDRFEIVDIAIKAVGVSSVGTRCSVMLLMAGERDPLFLQVKEARSSVLEAFAGKSVHPNHGQRVVMGQRRMQAASDLFLGWTEVQDRHYYVRQLRDMKIKLLVDLFPPRVMSQYADLCGGILARAHARCSEPALISGYLGRSDKFDEAIADFAIAYADQTERDHRVFEQAVRAGKVEVLVEAV